MHIQIPDNTHEFARLRTLTANFILSNPKNDELPLELANVRDLLIDGKIQEAAVVLTALEINQR